MNKPKKIFVKVKKFPKHDLQLLFSLPPHIEFDESHDDAYSCNMLVIRNDEGHTKVYSMGMDVYNADDLHRIFIWE
jgi:hypothetical protein